MSWLTYLFHYIVNIVEHWILSQHHIKVILVFDFGVQGCICCCKQKHFYFGCKLFFGIFEHTTQAHTWNKNYKCLWRQTNSNGYHVSNTRRIWEICSSFTHIHTQTFLSSCHVEGLTKDHRWALTPRDVS